MHALKETVYTPVSPIRNPGKLVAEMIRDLFASRELAWRLFVRDVSAQYRQSALGYLWAFAPPVVSAVPWLFLSSQRILNTGETPIHYAAFVLAGTTLWSAFSDSLTAPLNALNAGRPMMSKINFPREALILASLGQIVTNLAIRVAVMLVIFAVLGVSFVSPSLLLAPFGVAAIIIAGLSLGMLIAPVGMLYTDAGRCVGMISGFWMILTPVVYMPPTDGFAGVLARWNPASPLITTARDWFTGQSPVQLSGFLIVTLASLVILLVSWMLLRLCLPILVERMGG